jgi:TonB family protein
MPHALLLSPDDQAVSAITGVLEEMSVTCERPLDGVSAAQKLNAQSFDLVLVDCENLPAAKLIFDVCRRGKNGNNPVPIAIVDGRAGLPTAFRLGAELILTKPVAKDQARSTIRTAVSRVRKDVPTNVPTNESASPQPASTDTSNAATPGAVMTAVVTEERALAAAAAASSSQLTSFADPAPSFVPAPVPSAAAATLSAPAVTTKMNSAVIEIDATPASPKLNPKSAPSSASSSSDLSKSSWAQAASVNWKPTGPMKLSDDPVLAELERTEREKSEPAESQPAESQKQSSGPSKAARVQSAAESGAPVFSSYPQGRQKTRGALVALLMLTIAGGGFYAAWMYQPGFRAIAQPQIDRVLALAGMALPPAPAASPTKPSAPLAPGTTPSPAVEPATDVNKTATVPDSTKSSIASSATGTATTSTAATVPVRPAATPGMAVTPSIPGATTIAAPVVGKPEANQSSATRPSDSKKDTAPTSSDAQLTGENSAIILSSKGAEKRLAYSFPPKYPVEARSGGAEGTVVLKAVVDENGKVEGLRLVEGNATLATAAMQAVKQWRYRPYVREGKAQPFQTVVIVDFQRP